MANTYSQITIHIVFTVKDRQCLLKKEMRENLYKYITGIIKKEKQKPLAIGGMSDHIHLLIGINPEIKISDLVRSIKANSSKWINENKYVAGKFNWQEGYGVFSYSHSQRDDVIKYIMEQEKHHKARTFREEYLDMLKKFDVEHDTKYLFDWIE